MTKKSNLRNLQVNCYYVLCIPIHYIFYLTQTLRVEYINKNRGRR